MISIIVVLPRSEDAKGLRNLLMKNGFRVDSVCTTGSQALSRMDDLSGGIVICSYRMSDMMYSDLHACLPKGFEMLLIASANMLQECDCRDIMSLSMPLKVHDLINTVDMMTQAIERRKKRERQRPKERSAEEEGTIKEAKELGFAGTPYFLVNNLVVRGAVPLETFIDAVEFAKAGKK